MCRDCLIEIRPDAGNQATDSGANMLNYKGCINCKQLTLLKSINLKRDVEEDDDEDGNDDASEEVSFQHSCTICDHIVAEHFYTYFQDNEEQTYHMDCFLCGHGGKSIQFNTAFEDLCVILPRRDDNNNNNNSGDEHDHHHHEVPIIVKPALNLVAALNVLDKFHLLNNHNNDGNNDNNDADDDDEWK